MTMGLLKKRAIYCKDTGQFLVKQKLSKCFWKGENMRRMKKLTALLLTCVMAVSAVGCGNVVDKTTSDTVLWINGTYAVLTKLNSCGDNGFGGVKANSMNKEIMQEA